MDTLDLWEFMVSLFGVIGAVIIVAGLIWGFLTITPNE